MGASVGQRRVKTYSLAEKQRVALTFAIEGNISRTARKLNMPADTIQGWTSQEWWPAMITSVKEQKQIELDSRLTQVIDNAVTETLDRLANGDAATYKGEVIYKPVSGRDAATIAAIAYDKRALMRGDPTSRTERISTDSRLKTLQAEFRTASDAEIIAKS